MKWSNARWARKFIEVYGFAHRNERELENLKTYFYLPTPEKPPKATKEEQEKSRKAWNSYR